MTAARSLLETAERGVAIARELGADEAEVFATGVRSTSVDVQKDDVHNAATAEESTFGIRVLLGGAMGFATTNNVAHLRSTCEEAVAIARVAPPDEHNRIAAPEPVEALDEAPDRAIAELGVGELVAMAANLVDRVKSRDARVVVDSGAVSADCVSRAIATSTGIREAEERTQAGGYLFGMALDGDEVGSFDHDGHSVRRLDELLPQLEAAADRFVIKTTGSLGARKGESFRGPAILSPEVVQGFVLGNLAAVLSGRAGRTGRSPLAGAVGTRIADPAIDLVDDARVPYRTRSCAFDREGSPTRRLHLIVDGVLQGFLYDVYEAAVAGGRPTGHARGSAGSQPAIAPSNLLLRPGGTLFEQLCTEPERAVVVTRFSGSSNPVTGEFSGVVKGGFLMRQGERTPIRETLVAGNLYELLKRVSGVSSELRDIDGHASIPALRIEDLSITAG